MAVPQIIYKIDEVIQSTSTWTEVEVTYVLVQTRKLLDHAKGEIKNGEYTQLRFYCDWVVHVNKDYIDANTLKILKGVESGMKEMMGRPSYHSKEPISFAYFDNLQKELADFLVTQGISPTLTESDVWIDVISSLVKILENQPLNIKASYGMITKSFEFQPSAPRTVWLRAIFNESFQAADGVSYGYFDLKNAY